MSPILLIGWLSFSGLLVALVHSKTDSKDVSALNVMFTSMNSPGKLSYWQSNGGDPCGDSWKGVSCSGSSVTEIRLSGFGLSGSLGYQLSDLKSVTYFDVSKNKFKSDIPYQLPPNVEHLDLSKNGLTGAIPYSISEMSSLKYLDLSSNQLNGNLQDMFSKLQNLDLLDVSDNKLSSDLPQSLGSLSGISTLYLQDNQFTGEIKVLDKLAKQKLQDLNLSNNKFTGWIPSDLTTIGRFEAGGNSWNKGQAPQGMVSGDSIKSTAPSHKKGGLYVAMIAGIVIGVLVVVVIALTVLTTKKSSFSSSYLDEPDNRRKSFYSHGSSRYASKELGMDARTSYRDVKPSDSSSVDINALQSSGPIGFKASLSSHFKSMKLSEPASAKAQKRSSFEVTPYALGDLQNATSNFSTNRLLGEGSIGRVYKAKYPDEKLYIRVAWLFWFTRLDVTPTTRFDCELKFII